jgi:hypothetical protein
MHGVPSYNIKKRRGTHPEDSQVKALVRACILIADRASNRHSGESRNPVFYFSGCGIKSGMTAF